MLFVAGALTLASQMTQAANDPTPGPAKVTEVTFDDGIAIKNDDGVTDMPTPHWEDKVNNEKPTDDWPDGQPDKNDPHTKPNQVKSFAYGYVSNTKPKVKAIFKWKDGPPPEGRPYKAKGVVIDTDNSTFELKLKELPDDVTYDFEIASKNVVDDRKIQAYLTSNRKVERKNKEGIDKAKDLKPLKIRWTVYDKNDTPMGESDSTHTIYVTWDEPKGSFKQETLFNISCVCLNGSTLGGANDSKTCAEAIFKDFEEREVKKMNGDTMWYYKDYYNVNVYLADILKFGEGQCYGWSQLFAESHSIQGIDITSCLRRIAPKKSVEQFYIKAWEYIGNGTSQNANYPYVNREYYDKDNLVRDKYDYFFEEFKDKAGLPAQGVNQNPATKFMVHYLVEIGGLLYCPAFGLTYENLAAFENNVDGFSIESQTARIFDEAVENKDINRDKDKIDKININGQDVWEILIRKNDPDVTDLYMIPDFFIE